MTISILFYSLRETESQSVSPRVQPTSSLAQWVSFPVMCISKPLGLGSPWHPALVAVCWWRASKRPQAHAHPHAHTLGQRAVKVEVHALCVHKVTEQDGVYITVKAIRDVLHLQVGSHSTVGVVLLPLVTSIPRLVVVVVVAMPGVGHTLMVSSRVRLVTGVRCGRQATGVLGNVHDAGRVGRQGWRCREVGTGPIVARGLEAVGLQDVSANPWGKGLRVKPTVHRVVRVVGAVVGVVVVHVTLAGAWVVIMAGVYFVTVTVLVTWTVVMGWMGLVGVAVVEAGLVFVTLIVVVMMGCILVMN